MPSAVSTDRVAHTGSPAIKCDGLIKTYPGNPPVEAVKGISFEVQRGECYGVLGPNGAGKTTTIEILEGLLDATAGTAEVLGINWGRDDAAIQQRIGVSLQETRLSDRLTVGEIVALFRSFYRNGIAPEDALRKTSLIEKKNAWFKTLSGGQKQRLAVATALVGDPDLIFLDEPTTGLDPGSRRELWDIVKSFGDAGKTVLLTTHYMEEAEQLCDRVAIFDAGKIICEGPPRELIRSLGSEHVIEFSTDRPLEQKVIDGLNTIQSVDQVSCDQVDCRLSIGQPHVVLPELILQLTAANYHLTDLATRSASLEDVFVAKTGRHLADEANVNK
jgi:ABC-2 type transport system ATP-binding protein